MRTYVVGGAVRDRLLGLPVSDRDHVVVGATVDEMLAAGFKPVGRDFPVFLHPQTHEEYALARTERKVAPGYAGFVFHADRDVTLDEDLARRDLTINAMAEDDVTHAVIDPFDGRRDLRQRVFRHVSPAFVEDPVRILRIARFAARFPDFTIADETLALMRDMVDAGEVDALVPERVWQELSRGLLEARPVRMLEVLRDAHALRRLVPVLDATLDDAANRRATFDALARAVGERLDLDQRFALLLHRLPSPDDAGAVATRLAVARSTRELAVMLLAEVPTLIEAGAVGVASPATAQRLAEALARTDAFRRPARFAQLVGALAATIADRPTADRTRRVLHAALAAARDIDAGAIAREEGCDAARIGQRLQAARLAAIESALAAGVA